MKQSRTLSLVESVTNVFVGLLVALGVQLAIFPLFGISISLPDHIGIAGCFVAASLVRSYVLRRVFEVLR